MVWILLCLRSMCLACKRDSHAEHLRKSSFTGCAAPLKYVCKIQQRAKLSKSQCYMCCSLFVTLFVCVALICVLRLSNLSVFRDVGKKGAGSLTLRASSLTTCKPQKFSQAIVLSFIVHATTQTCCKCTMQTHARTYRIRRRAFLCCAF